MISAQIISYLFLANLLVLVLVSPRASSAVQYDQTKAFKAVRRTLIGSGEDSPPARYQVFHIKNTKPFFLDGPAKRRKMTKKIKNTTRATPNFSVMLPKGFVPPSGSSPCHNGNPNSVVFFCSRTKP